MAGPDLKKQRAKLGTVKHQRENLTVFVHPTIVRPLTGVFASPSDERTRMSKLQHRCICGFLSRAV